MQRPPPQSVLDPRTENRAVGWTCPPAPGRALPKTGGWGWAVAFAWTALWVAGCGAPPGAMSGPVGADQPLVLPHAPDGRTVLLGVALRQETPPAFPGTNAVFCHVDLVVGGRVAGFYNTFVPRPGFGARLSRAWDGAFREYDWLVQHRPYYVDADAARRAVVKGRHRPVVTTWVSTRVTPATARRIEAALDARRDVSLLYRLAERNCATRLAEVLAEAGWFPPDGGASLEGVDRPVKLARAFAARAGPSTTTARGWFSFDPAAGVVRIESLP